MPRATFAPPPGIVRGITPAVSAGRWYDSNNMRWRQNTLQPIGGFAQLPNSVLDSPGRDLLTFHDNHSVRWAIIGTDAKLWAYNFGLETLTDITPAGVGGLDPPGPLLGYGTGNYSMEAYGTAREPSDVGPSDISSGFGDQWSLALFGQDVYVVPTQDGGLYSWSPDTPGTPAAPVANAPLQNAGVFVTDQRFVVLYGAGGVPRQVAWCSQENPADWTPTASNTAGNLMLETEGRCLGAIRSPNADNLILTDGDAHRLHYVGPPYVFGLVKIAANCGLLSRRAYLAGGGRVFWVGKKTFWTYSGGVDVFPCDVGDWFFSLLNWDFSGRIFASANPQYTELWWFFPDVGSTECNRWVALNYGGQQVVWTIGQMNRAAGDITGALDRPILCCFTPALNIHEFGITANGATRVGQVYVETGDIELSPGGEKRFHVRQLAHDFTGDLGSIGFRFFLAEETDGPEIDTGVYPMMNSNGLTDMRFSARVCRMRVEAMVDSVWALGKVRALVREGGYR